MKKTVALILIFSLTILAVGCSSAKPVLGKVAFDMTPEQVTKAVGKENIVDGSTDMILNQMHTTDYPAFGDRTVSIGFVFANRGTEEKPAKKLANITVQVFLKEGEEVEAGLAAVRNSLEEVYGDATEEGDGYTWSVAGGTLTLSPLGKSTTFVLASFAATPVAREN